MRSLKSPQNCPGIARSLLKSRFITHGTQRLGQRSGKGHILLRLARCFGAFFNKLLQPVIFFRDQVLKDGDAELVFR